MASEKSSYVIGGLLIVGAVGLALRTQSVYDAAIAAGHWCTDSERMIPCGFVISVAANIVTSRFRGGRVLLEPVAKMCAENPKSCLWLGGVISYAVIEPAARGEANLYLSHNATREITNIPPAALPSEEFLPKIQRWTLPSNTGISRYCSGLHGDACADDELKSGLLHKDLACSLFPEQCGKFNDVHIKVLTPGDLTKWKLGDAQK